MKKITDIISKNNIIILVLGILLLIPAIFGFVNTKINYNILMYLPEDIETIQGQNILTKDFNMGSFAFVIVDMKDVNKVISLENKIKKIEGINRVFSLADVLGTTIPKEMLPKEVEDALYSNDKSVILVTFEGSASSNITTQAVSKLRETVDDASHVSTMTAMLLDTRTTANREIFSYILIAVILCSIILILTTNSYVLPIFLLGNIGIAILYNMGTNILLGEISYITKAISTVLQLGVTTDFSIFLYHQYENECLKEKDRRKAMSKAIQETFKSVLGSSFTTIAGFLALCTMDLGLGKDIGLVMAKGVLFGLITVLTIFPATLLTFDKVIEKTKHKIFFPTFKRVQSFVERKYKLIFVIFLIAMIPAYIGNKNYDVYYKLDDSLPKTLPFAVANRTLAEEFNIISPEIIILNKDIKKSDVEELTEEIKNVEGVDFVIPLSTLIEGGAKDLVPEELHELVDNDKYQLVILNSVYEIASDELNDQVEKINTIVKKYDMSSIVAGEGPLMKDLVTIADHDFKTVNYTSVVVIFIIMLLVLQSFSLPVLLIFTIEFAIFLNMACAYFTGSSLPFIASIVVGTIQLGATIDYAILMSTTYLENRKDKSSDKMKAMSKTLTRVIPSIVTSALCFLCATIGVGFITQLDMIGSICILLARGSMISMIVVVTILPALLLIFDKIILKTTKIKKEG